MKLITRNKSVITGKENLENLYSFKNFPVFMGCVDTPTNLDLKANMDWAIDPESGIIQLINLIPPEILYQSSHNDGTGPTWEQYYQDFSTFIAKVKKPTNILEIGGGAGRIAEIYTETIKNANWTIIEPNPLRKENAKIKIVDAFFDNSTKLSNDYDAIVHSQVLEHVYDPDEFLQNIAQRLPTGGSLIFAYPNLEYFLANKHTNTLNFEHTLFLTDSIVDFLLAKHGFNVIEKQNYKNHDYFYHAQKNEVGTQKIPNLANQYSSNKKLFTDFIEYHLELITRLNSEISKRDKKTFLFGAHIFSQYLLQFGLKEEMIDCILDNSPMKQGKRLYGTDLTVKSPEILANIDNPTVILKVGIYRDEIFRQLLKINPSTTILE